jgi:D-alanyl-D-alanine-carboxypeptidase/D-alanyl-D-alanine-endopeptidase
MPASVRRGWNRGRAFALILSMLLVLPTSARTLDSPPADLDALAQQLYRTSQADGLVIAWVTPAQYRVIGLGRQDARHSGVPSGHSLLRIGSLSKLFTAQVLSHLIAQGRVSLATPLQTLAPAGSVLPDGKLITLGNLVSHTSGLPAKHRCADPRTQRRSPAQASRNAGCRLEGCP